MEHLKISRSPIKWHLLVIKERIEELLKEEEFVGEKWDTLNNELIDFNVKLMEFMGEDQDLINIYKRP